MKLAIHGNTPYAWAAAIQMAALGNDILLCPAWYTLIDTPDAELLREPGLAALLQEQRRAGRLRFAIGKDCDTAATGVTQHWMAGEAHPGRLRSKVDTLLASQPPEAPLPVIVVLSAYPVGTLPALRQHVHDGFPGRSPSLLMLPLFARAGSLLSDFVSPVMLLIGSDESGPALAELLEVLRPVSRRARDVLVVPLAAAELIKASVNAMLATRISFMNEMAAFCEQVGVDVELVRQGLAADPRIGSDYLQPGCGFGGPSFSSELLSFARTLQSSLARDSLIKTAIDINEHQRELLFRKLWRYFDGHLAGRSFAIWGAAYKPGSAVVKDSAVHPLLQALWAQGARTVVHDPLAGDTLRIAYADQALLRVVDSPYAATEAADALILVTACEVFQSLDYERLRQTLKQPVIFDGRNIYDPNYLADLGFTYVGIGRGVVV